MKPTKEGMGDQAMKKSLFYRVKKMPPSAQIMLLFAVEGVFLQYITSINGFGLNLYATNMGATDSQIGIIQMVPNIVACAALLPLGILADHLKSTKTIPLLTLLMMCAGYAFLGSVPVLGERRSCFWYHWHLLRGHLLFTMRSGRRCSVLRFRCDSEMMSMPFGISSCL